MTEQPDEERPAGLMRVLAVAAAIVVAIAVAVWRSS